MMFLTPVFDIIFVGADDVIPNHRHQIFLTWIQIYHVIWEHKA
jgi:hypothetical protein